MKRVPPRDSLTTAPLEKRLPPLDDLNDLDIHLRMARLNEQRQRIASAEILHKLVTVVDDHSKQLATITPAIDGIMSKLEDIDKKISEKSHQLEKQSSSTQVSPMASVTTPSIILSSKTPENLSSHSDTDNSIASKMSPAESLQPIPQYSLLKEALRNSHDQRLFTAGLLDDPKSIEPLNMAAKMTFQ